jgi:hypothetical protein
VAQTTTSALELGARTRRLYRHALKIIPWLQDTYEINYEKDHMRAIIRHHFERHVGLDKGYTSSVLLHQGENDLQEALNIWKTRSHVVKFFEPDVIDNRSVLAKLWAGDISYKDLVEMNEDSASWTYPPPADGSPRPFK